MKRIISLLILTSTFSFSQEDLRLTCCLVSSAKCTGNIYCTACTNCNYCAYCNNGGSCGVCSYSPSTPNIPRTNGSIKYSENYMEDEINSSLYKKVMFVNNEYLNFRTGPGTNFSLISKLNKGDKLLFLASKNGWVKVKSLASGKIGYVYGQYLDFL